MTAVELFNAGFKDLVSVIPPGATLSPLSKVKPDSVGKAPGRQGPSGWAGYAWQTTPFTAADAAKTDATAANIGLRADKYPGVDIDCTDASLSSIIERIAFQTLGPAPKRVGRFPKALLQYRTEEPFGRLRLWMKYEKLQHLLEILGVGQQYVVEGIHPGTKKPYTWDKQAGSPDELVAINKAQALEFLTKVKAELEFLGVECELEGSGALPAEKANVPQAALRAPAIEALEAAVGYIPNDAPSYDEYVEMGIAIKAACGGNLHAGLTIFQEWAGRWEHGENTPDNVARDWARMKSPFRIGWDYIAQRARRYGYNDAGDDFDVLAEAPEATPSNTAPPEYSDRAMASRLIKTHGHEIKYCEAIGGWLVWDTTRWSSDETLRVFDWAGLVLAEASNEALGRTDFNTTKAERIAMSLASTASRSSCVNYAKADSRVVVRADAFDADPMLLNTPAGVVELKSGLLRDRLPGELFMKRTAATPDFANPPTRFLKFLRETQAGNEAVVDYLQKYFGYSLTGSTIEQNIVFMHGSGGNGKSVLVNTIGGILNDYAAKATMETFTASNSDRHPTELARLRGARFVYASETQGGKRWNESRIKELTGGEPITARFMHRDEFTFMPTFKLNFLGNHKPELRTVDGGIRRRLHLIPFLTKPEKPDSGLQEALMAEWPQILGWMIQGCLKWQKEGLQAPEEVLAATEEYFEDEDALGRWLKERCHEADEATVLSQDLFNDWREWCGENGEYVGSQKKLSTNLKDRGFHKWRDPYSGRNGFRGLELIHNPGEFNVTTKQGASNEVSSL
jgi:P4 family phage/plasmid primase-like protien